MYYEEKVMYGVLCCRTVPDGQWRPVETYRGRTISALINMTPDQRMDVFGYFCTHCGRDDPKCQCWNDE